MALRFFIPLLLVTLFLNSCDWNITDDDAGGAGPDSTAMFKNVSSQNLPGGLAGNTQEAKAADVDGDNDFDLVLAIRFQTNRILINDGTGNFSTESPILLSSRNFDTQGVSIADFNSDGAPDIIFVSGESRSHELYLNEENGVFADLTNRIPVTANSTTVATADINGDGPVDIAIGNLAQNFILINNGNASFADETPQRIPSRQDRTLDIEFGDVTGDNLLDMTIANADLNRLLVNTGSGFFAEQNERLPFLDTVYETSDVELGDVDGDADLDIYFANTGFQSDADPKDLLLINEGQGFFSDRTDEQLPELMINSIGADFSDLDNDLDLDIVIRNYDGGIRVLINDGNGVFTDETDVWIPDNFSPLVNDLEVALLNEDRLPDIYISVRGRRDQLLFQRGQ